MIRSQPMTIHSRLEADAPRPIRITSDDRHVKWLCREWVHELERPLNTDGGCPDVDPD